MLESHEALAEVSNNNVVILRWIKSHGPAKSNRLTDSLSKKIANKLISGPSISIGLTISIVTTLIKAHSLVKIKER